MCKGRSFHILRATTVLSSSSDENGWVQKNAGAQRVVEGQDQ